MLKLERDKTTQEVCIRTNRGETLFTKLFLFALSVALALHAAFFLIFRIDKGHENYPQLILPPINVEAAPQHIESAEHYTLTEYEAHVLAKQKSYEPVPLPVTIPAISSQGQVDFFTAEMQHDEPALFSSLEAEFLLNQLYPVEIKLSIPQLEIHLSGPLKDLYQEDLKHPFLNKTILLPIHQIEQKRYHFAVIVDNSTGKIIWFEKQQETPEELQHLLLELNFEINPSRGFVTKGQIEMLATRQMRKYD